jgi:uncharacterized delta-60 repeat protein
MRRRGKWHLTLISLALLLGAVGAADALGRPGRVDVKFGLNVDLGGRVNAIETQTDGKVVIAGSFHKALPNERFDILRLNADHTVDTTFNAGTATQGSGTINSVFIQPDGKILIGGTFNRFNGVSTSSPLLRLNADGNADTTFNVTGLDVTSVYDIDRQSTGKILASASNLNGSSFIARFSVDGSWDQTSVRPGGTGFGFRIDVTSDDRVLVGGTFAYAINGNTFRNLTRLTSALATDTSFAADVETTGSGFVEPSEIIGGRILIWGGGIISVNQVPRRGVAILLNNGNLDASFDPAPMQTEIINAAAIQDDGKVLIAGESFTRWNTFVRGNLARLNADGSLDSNFYVGRGFEARVRAIKVASSARVLVGGDFSRYDRVIRRAVVKVVI